MGLFYYAWALDQSRTRAEWREQLTHVTSFEAADVMHRSLEYKKIKVILSYL